MGGKNLSNEFEGEKSIRLIEADNAILRAQDSVVSVRNGANNWTVHVGPESAEPLPDGWTCESGKTGAGDVTYTRGAGVIFHGLSGDVDIKNDGERGTAIVLRRIAENEFEYFGNYQV